MSKKMSDTDFLTISAMLRAREAGMLGSERMDRMLAAGTYSEAAKLLTDCGYPDMSECDAKEIDRILSEHRGEVFGEVGRLCPSEELVDVFRLKYDYHNIKVLVKSEGAGVTGEHLYSYSGLVSPAELAEIYAAEEWSRLPEGMGGAAAEAKSILARTGNPQLADFAVDKAYFAALTELCGAAGGEFMAGYARILIDSANLRTVVRTVRMGKDADFLMSAMAPGGSAAPERLAAAAASGGEGLASIFTAEPLHDAAALGAEVMKEGSMTKFELLCDNAVSAYMTGAKMKPFGPECVAEYLSLVENEITAVRMILTGKLAGIAPDVLRERLRDINA